MDTKQSNAPTISKIFIDEIIAAMLLLYFVHSIISIYVNIESLKNLLAFYTLNVTGVAWLILIAELLIAIALLVPNLRFGGFIAVTLAASFAGYIVIDSPHKPHDFGGILNDLSVTQQLFFYSMLVLLALTGVYTTKRNKSQTAP